MKRKRKIKNAVLKTMAALNAMAFAVSACMIDSESWIPTAVCLASELWLAAFAYANRHYGVYMDEYEEVGQNGR